MNVHSSTASGGNGLNMEAAQLVVGAAILDSRFRTELLQSRDRALRTVDRLAVAPPTCASPPATVAPWPPSRRPTSSSSPSGSSACAVPSGRAARPAPASHEERLVG